MSLLQKSPKKRELFCKPFAMKMTKLSAIEGQPLYITGPTQMKSLSFAKEPYKNRALLQKKPTILWNLPLDATP